MDQPLISAIICTHNRANYLKAAVDSLRSQTYHPYDIIIIDNASTDNTRQVIEAFGPDPPITYVYEGTLGLSTARNRGAQVARGQILAYLDDDAEAATGWLAALAMAFAPPSSVAIAGGRVRLAWPPGYNPPLWLSPGMLETLGIYDLGPAMRPITNPQQTPRGLNYAIQKSVWQAMGGFNVDLGRVGHSLLSNEELYMTQRVLAAGLGVLYVPQAEVTHQVAPNRLRRRWFLHRSWWQGISECHRDRLEQTLTLGSIGSRSLNLVRGLRKGLSPGGDPSQRFEHLAYSYGQLGYVCSGIGHLAYSRLRPVVDADAVKGPPHDPMP